MDPAEIMNPSRKWVGDFAEKSRPRFPSWKTAFENTILVAGMTSLLVLVLLLSTKPPIVQKTSDEDDAFEEPKLSVGKTAAWTLLSFFAVASAPHIVKMSVEK
jgi:hypothetical protein